jgi:hypothetical protein
VQQAGFGFAYSTLGGDPESDVSRAHARELLESASAPAPAANQRKKTRS